jgi:hypothetical protein
MDLDVTLPSTGIDPNNPLQSGSPKPNDVIHMITHIRC